MVDYRQNYCTLILLLVICAGIACLCVFVIPKQDVILTILSSLLILILFLTLSLLYYFGEEIRRRCCNKKSESLLNAESQKTHDDSTTREKILNQRISWREYPDNSAREVI
jgi:hypothetical protein